MTKMALKRFFDRRQIGVRAHLYLSVIVFRTLITGVIAIIAGTTGLSEGYEIIEKIAPMSVWGVLSVLVAGTLITALFCDNARIARMAVVASAILTGLWAFGLVGAAFGGIHVSWIAPVVWGSLAAKDLLVASAPYSTPVDDLLRERPDLVKSLGLIATKNGSLIENEKD